MPTRTPARRADTDCSTSFPGRHGPRSALLLLALTLSACGSGQPTGQATDPSALTPEAIEAKLTSGDVDLSEITHYGDPVTASGDGPYVQPDVDHPDEPYAPTLIAAQQGLASARQAAAGARLGETRVPGTLRGQTVSAQGLSGLTLTPDRVQLQVLILHAGPADFGLPSARALLQSRGIPFTTLDATTTPLDAAALVAPDGAGRYQAVILTSNALTTETSPGYYESALSTDEWSTLFEYERTFGARQLALFGYPQVAPEDYGLRAAPELASSTADLTVTPAGKAVFTDLTGAVPVRYAYNYPSRLEPVEGVTTTPVLTDAGGNILAATSTSPDGRERMLLTMAQNPYLLHTQLLGDGLIGWLTRGVHLGEYRRFLQVDIDDWFLYADRFDPATGTVVPRDFRLRGSDALSLRDQQNAIRAQYPVAANFRYAQAFNGLGADVTAPNTCAPSASVNDPLSAVTKCVAKSFDWVNHSRDHLNMDTMNRSDSFTQLYQNALIGSYMRLPMSLRAVVTPEHSGLGWYAPAPGQNKVDYGLNAGNRELMQATSLMGMRYVASNHSVPSQWDPQCPNCGVTSPLNPLTLLVPRWPNSVAYNSTAPDEAAGQYNAVFGPGGTAPYWPKNLNYDEFLAQDMNISVIHLLDGTAWPHYMHQGNLKEYAPGRSLATDWVRALLDTYSAYSTLPLNTLDWNSLGQYVDTRTRYEGDKNSVVAVFDRKANTVKVQRSSGSGTRFVFLTGASASATQKTEVYAGRRTAQFTVGSLTTTVPVTPR
ncbi:hypothetical protein GCM10008959_28130 [Deinococcus seoulensis]|uniref:Agd3 CBM87 domain-containing protein n=1 Tax=Deinococcus seoulensis TaxID=1837379 RepID=A0ABQ2RXN9_9DEIO|nr:hypothetical protein [Deinococcus seoulensis]GGR64402.1 hypothetical protein GCM10008959_28130 [Deinococcus seoulensis]